jgi:osmotically inducible protein OsmC
MAGTQRTATARWSGDLMKGSGAVHLDSSGVGPELPVTWTSRTESPGGKTSPEELIAAAHAACFSMALSHGLAGAGHPAERLTTQATSTFEKTDAGFRMTKMHLSVRGSVPGMSGDDFMAAARAAKDGCPVSNALKGNVEIDVDAALE